MLLLLLSCQLALSHMSLFACHLLLSLSSHTALPLVALCAFSLPFVFRERGREGHQLTMTSREQAIERCAREKQVELNEVPVDSSLVDELLAALRGNEHIK